MTTCTVCGSEVPEGEYCGACGASLVTGSVHRPGAFVVDPHQHILFPNVVSTLFPHLPHRHSVHFRLALFVVAVLLVVLGMARLAGPAIAVAALSVPLLYVLYLYEVDDEEPFLTILLTFGVGLVIGIPWAIWTGPLVTRALVHTMTAGLSASTLFTEGVILPLIAQVLMLIGPLILYVRGKHREPVDGFAFGAASGLGFTLALSLINLAPQLRFGFFSPATPTAETIVLVGRGLILPFLNASTTGLITGALWSARLPRRRLPWSWTGSIAAALIGAAIVRIILGTVDISVIRTGVVLTIFVLLAAAVLLWVRLGLHFSLLAAHPIAAIGPALPCTNCHRIVPRMAFCPHCGVAVQATPKVGAGRARAAQESPATAPVEPPHVPATPQQLAAMRRPHGSRHVGILGGVLAVCAIALGVAAALLAPARHAACRLVCAPQPPPCIGTCTQMVPAPPLRSTGTYTSSKFHYSVAYADFKPAGEDSQSVEWDLSGGSGQYTIQVTADTVGGDSSEQILKNVIDNNFSDYSYVYTIPGADIGYVSGSGAVYDNQVTPFFGSSSDTRLAVLTAVHNGLAIAVVADGDAGSQTSGHANPSQLPISTFVDSLALGTHWPGEPPR